ncbi:iron-containing alcohol dehydrogenase [Leucobacter weissii]|uniref:Iron-containing alcohol dehydrogenase n=1 Tax=Leucobacter weissii TaxID=1983706 RepID=A0A939MLJ9_9MICO|nr:iron-containing alcohol dehydrogenase [Leucobacter weissii]MBO1903228.1 iron-containing alcohol dehydrogenase [Leucobacter weissii]
MTYEVSFPRLVLVGGGAVAELADIVSRLGITRPFVVTDAFLKDSGGLDRIVDLLTAAGFAVGSFAETVADPTTVSVATAVQAASEHDADGVIALGGGSPIDTAKAMAVLAKYSGEMHELKAPASYDGPALPVIAIPTTAGTGSEATRFTVITDSRTGEKMLCAGGSYMPAAAIVDYELTTTMPPRLTADTGIDALTHAVEAYVSTKANPISDALALTAVRLIGRNLRRAYTGADLVARDEMMAAATMAGMAFSNSSVALVHGMSRPLGAHFHIAHGLANAMLFAEVTSFSVDAAPERYAACARELGLGTPDSTTGELGAELVTELRALANDLEVPTPAQLGIEREDWAELVPVMVAQAIASGSPANNPRVPTEEQIAEIFHTIFDLQKEQA